MPGGKNSERFRIYSANNNPVLSPIKLKLPTNSKIVKLRFKCSKFIASTNKQEIIVFHENKWSILPSRFPITYHPDYLLLRYLALETEVFSLNEEKSSQLENLLKGFAVNQPPKNSKAAIRFLEEMTNSQQNIIDILLQCNSFDKIKQLLKNQTKDLKDPIQNGLLKLIQTYIEGYKQTTFSFTFFKSDKCIVDKLNETLKELKLCSADNLNLLQTFDLFIHSRRFFGDETENVYVSSIDLTEYLKSELNKSLNNEETCIKPIHKPC